MATGITINCHFHHVVSFKQHNPERLNSGILDLPVYGEPELPPIEGTEFQLILPEIEKVQDSQENIHGVEPDFNIADEIDIIEMNMDD